jgi:hypothetical protein
MARDISYSSERFGRALSYLALHEGTYRERLKSALAEALHNADDENPRPIPDELLERIRAFSASVRPVDELSDEEAQDLGVEFLILASDIACASRG